MPRGIKGYRWIETGYKVWQLEDKPRHFLGVVSCTSDPECWSWWTRLDACRDSGYAATPKLAKLEVEKRVIPAQEGGGDGS